MMLFLFFEKKMPTVPVFTNDAQKRRWLRQYFESKSDFDAVGPYWGKVIKRCAKAESGSSAVATYLISAMSTVLSGFITLGNADNATDTPYQYDVSRIQYILSWCTTAIGLSLSLFILICNRTRIPYEQALKALNESFPESFFQGENATDQIWVAAELEGTLWKKYRRECGDYLEPGFTLCC
jgi:hypothetical protein